ncbi:ABC transporter ATP-binding protein [Pseudomonas mosselii]|uniref:ABC transporter ATP-binding protein n=1 Tax=Pseudomonas mosselii TaxID=78327 RepID=UPI001645C051|nr:ABC transporter ATP-binding protein [Pseudomonas mosselii]MBC3451312.1 ABC transporter ATP-binding protein [Pseudomonas mosselii]
MSSSEFAIRVEGVSKRFEIFEHPRDQLKQFIYPRLRRLFGRPERDYFREFWALREVFLDIRKGDSCAIVGLNGSGKSTLLQIITGTLTPTTGKVSVNGRVAALLELGSGFNPDFSGRENVYMNGALLGFSRREVEARIPDIEAFADIGEHFDRALSTYSSGMQMRVAFAVSTAFEPDILIVDEALAVGDAYFQQKCFQRLESFRERGGTLLFVSHDANTVKHICNKALLLSHGNAISFGAPRDVIDLYQGLVAKKTDMSSSEISIDQSNATAAERFEAIEQPKAWTKATTITTNGDAELVDFLMLDTANRPVTHLESETSLTIRYVVKLNKDFERPAFGLIIRDRMGRSVFETSTFAMQMPDNPRLQGDQILVRFNLNMNLKAGQYSFSVGVANKGFARSEFEEYSLLMHDVEQLQVTESSVADFYGGIFNMHPVVTVDVLESRQHA